MAKELAEKSYNPEICVSKEAFINGRILIVDDEIETLIPICDLLSEWGYAVFFYETTKDSLEALKKRTFDILLADLVMPEMDGIELIKKAQAIDENLSCIIMTGHATVQSAVEAMKAGAFDFVLKPLDLKMLKITLSRAIQVTQLRRSKAIYQSMVEDHQTEFMCRFLPDGTFTFVNKVFCNYFSKTKEDLLKNNFMQFIVEEDREKVKKLFSNFNYENNTVSLEHRVAKQTGEIYWHKWVYRAIFEDNSNIKEIQAVGSDITKLKQAEAELRKSLERQQLLFKNTSDVIFSIDLETKITDVSPSVKKILDYGPEELINKSFIDLNILTEDSLKTAVSDYMRILSGEKVLSTYEFIAKDGTKKFIEINSTPLYHKDKITSMIAIARDITESKRAEEVRQLNESRMEVLLKLNQMAEASLKDITDFALEEGIRLTGSTIGYIAFMNEEETVLTMYSWSKAALEQCRIENKPVVFPIKNTGLWGEAVRRRKPIITNDYAAPNPLKKGYPEGHVHVTRHMNVPIFDGDNIVIVAGVGNKDSDYDDSDVRQLILLMDGMWRIVKRNQATEELRKSEARLAEAQRIAHLGNWDWNIQTNELYWSDEIYRIFGLTPQEFGATYEAFLRSVHPDDREFVKDAVNRALYEKTTYSVDHRIILPDGSERIVYEKGDITCNETGEPIRMLGTVQDITERKKMEERLEYLAYYDVLTGFPNRNLFLDRLTQGIARSKYKKKHIAVLTVDIDRFTFINNTYGFETGDTILKEVARTLSNSVREGDTVARLGSDEYGIALFEIAQPKDVIFVLEKIIKNISQPIKFDEKEIIVTLSIGIAVYPNDGKAAHELKKNADLALEKAKEQGGKNYQFYTGDLNVKAAEFIRMERDLFMAFKNREFVLYYQPYWEIRSKKLVGMEALIRWDSPEYGLVSPGRFIPVLEETKLIIDVGEWILRTACKQVKKWQNNGYQIVPVSVNLSLIQFRQKDLAEMVERVIRDNGYYPSLLTLEITESAFMQDLEITQSVIKKLKDIGIPISIDDFGTGYSSLSYLQKLPVDNLKIDMSFIKEIAKDPDAASLVSAIISMAHTLNIKTIAEGIETDEQWKILRLLKCDMGQGFYLSKPLPAKEVEKFFK